MCDFWSLPRPHAFWYGENSANISPPMVTKAERTPNGVANHWPAGIVPDRLLACQESQALEPPKLSAFGNEVNDPV
jgi:hypothetical protein